MWKTRALIGASLAKLSDYFLKTKQAALESVAGCTIMDTPIGFWKEFLTAY
jgi:hypothetical protein